MVTALTIKQSTFRIEDNDDNDDVDEKQFYTYKKKFSADVVFGCDAVVAATVAAGFCF